jgi:hypothetical protein
MDIAYDLDRIEKFTAQARTVNSHQQYHTIPPEPAAEPSLIPVSKSGLRNTLSNCCLTSSTTLASHGAISPRHLLLPLQLLMLLPGLTTTPHQ